MRWIIVAALLMGCGGGAACHSGGGDPAQGEPCLTTTQCDNFDIPLKACWRGETTPSSEPGECLVECDAHGGGSIPCADGTVCVAVSVGAGEVRGVNGDCVGAPFCVCVPL